jgi:hypothetical protein
MLGAVVLVVGALVAWIAIDQWILWLRERQNRGPSAWHDRGPGRTFHSTGFEDTLPPHEVVPQPLVGARSRQRAGGSRAA